MAQGNLKLQKKAKSTTTKKIQPKDIKKGGQFSEPKENYSLFLRTYAVLLCSTNHRTKERSSGQQGYDSQGQPEAGL